MQAEMFDYRVQLVVKMKAHVLCYQMQPLRNVLVQHRRYSIGNVMLS